MAMAAKKDDSICLSVLDVTKDNFVATWPSLIYAVKSSTFIALDLELSGLGDRKNLKASSVEDRYKALCSIAKSRSVISLGLSCFQDVNTVKTGQEQRFRVQTFNFLLLCNEEYTVEPQALSFLVSHGFDFNKQCSLGIPYSKGNIEGSGSKVSMHQLMTEVILASKPVILHNGFIDLVFLYECFYTNLPSTLKTFVADLCDIFKAGIFDTKYISEFHSRENLSVLEYLFRKCQHKNHQASLENDKAFIEIDSALLRVHDNKDIVHCDVPPIEITEELKKQLPLLCKNFQMRGFCPCETTCPKTHSIELIIIEEYLAEERQRNKRRKRKRKSNSLSASDDGNTGAKNSTDGITDCGTYEEANGHSLIDTSKRADISITENNERVNSTEGKLGETDFQVDIKTNTQPTTNENFQSTALPRLEGHRAGFDAFMTGFCFAYFRLNLTDSTELKELSNKIYLTAKDIPLHVIKSHFAKPSTQHQQMMKQIYGEAPS